MNPKHNFESRKLDTKDETYCIILYKVQTLIKLSMLVEVGKHFSLLRREDTVTGDILFVALDWGSYLLLLH